MARNDTRLASMYRFVRSNNLCLMRGSALSARSRIRTTLCSENPSFLTPPRNKLRHSAYCKRSRSRLIAGLSTGGPNVRQGSCIRSQRLNTGVKNNRSFPRSASHQSETASSKWRKHRQVSARSSVLRASNSRDGPKKSPLRKKIPEWKQGRFAEEGSSRIDPPPLSRGRTVRASSRGVHAALPHFPGLRPLVSHSSCEPPHNAPRRMPCMIGTT
jgi:hypothetical protein